MIEILLIGSGIAGLATVAFSLLSSSEGEVSPETDRVVPVEPSEPEEVSSVEVEAEAPAAFAPSTSPGSIPGTLSRSSRIPVTENEIEALARVIASEAGSGTRGEQRAIGWTARNRFNKKGSIYETQYPWRSQKGSDPPFSSARPPKNTHRKLAREILVASASDDPTSGATAFFEPKMQDAFVEFGVLARAGQKGAAVASNGVKTSDVSRFKNYYKNADTIRQNWKYGQLKNGKRRGGGDALVAKAGRFEFWGSEKLFAQRGGQVQTIVGAGGFVYDDIPDPLDVIVS